MQVFPDTRLMSYLLFSVFLNESSQMRDVDACADACSRWKFWCCRNAYCGYDDYFLLCSRTPKMGQIPATALLHLDTRLAGSP
ncbi:hypothetical protein V1515DRAFT_593505 [Lipomyces mesembrius]